MEFVTGLADANPDTVGSGSVVSFSGFNDEIGFKTKTTEDSTGSQSEDLELISPIGRYILYQMG